MILTEADQIARASFYALQILFLLRKSSRFYPLVIVPNIIPSVYCFLLDSFITSIVEFDFQFMINIYFLRYSGRDISVFIRFRC